MAPMCLIDAWFVSTVGREDEWIGYPAKGDSTADTGVARYLGEDFFTILNCMRRHRFCFGPKCENLSAAGAKSAQLAGFLRFRFPAVLKHPLGAKRRQYAEFSR